jgi:hypothetical protein
MKGDQHKRFTILSCQEIGLSPCVRNSLGVSGVFVFLAVGFLDCPASAHYCSATSVIFRMHSLSLRSSKVSSDHKDKRRLYCFNHCPSLGNSPLLSAYSWGGGWKSAHFFRPSKVHDFWPLWLIYPAFFSRLCHAFYIIQRRENSSNTTFSADP